MGRQLQTSMRDTHLLVAGNQYFSTGRTILDMSMSATKSGNHTIPGSPDLTSGMAIATRQYSISEHKLRAAAFAARVHSLKYYIGLIGARSII
jgi:hypothetical protein